MSEATLKVTESIPDDAYRGIVRIDAAALKKINAKPGDVIEIEGSRKTVAIADRAYPSDIGQNYIRMDGIIRRNASTSVGETIKIRKAQVQEAKRITIAPHREGVEIRTTSTLAFKKSLLRRPILKGDMIRAGNPRRRVNTSGNPLFDEVFSMMEDNLMAIGFGSLRFIVVETNPSKVPVVITENTEVVLNPKAVQVKDEDVPEINYEDIGGLQEEIKKIREMVELPLRHPEIFERLGVEPPKGLLLYGPPGTGKTMLAKAVASETNAHFIVINGPEVMSKYYGQSEENIRKKFEEAEKNAPSIIFIDEIDAIASKREDTRGEVERRVVAQMLALMDGLKARGKVVVIAATNVPNILDPALRRPGRFDREIEIGVPNKEARDTILKIHTRNMPLDKSVSLKEFASLTHGFVGADLASLAKEAAMVVVRRILPELKKAEDEETSIPQAVLEKMVITKKDFKEALKAVRPSALREVSVEVPNVSWKKVGGLEDVKQELKEAVEWPLKHPDAFKRLGVKPPKGILLYGPPGTGKTLLAKAVANESEANFISVKGPELLSKWVGESEKAVREIFKKARQTAPTIIFFDEIDSIAPRRGGSINGSSDNVTERVVNQLLTEIDGLQGLQDIVIIGATNRPDIVDTALLRPGRFDRIILTTSPSFESRKAIFEVHTKGMPLSNVDLAELARKTEGYVGADIESICREAAILALRSDIEAKEVRMEHFDKAMTVVRPSVTKDIEKSYEELKSQFSSARAKQMQSEKPAYFG